MVLPERYERYIQNLRTVRLLSKPQFPEQAEASAVLETFQQNAVQCFDLMQENNALLRELVFDRDPKTLTDPDISELAEFAGRLFHYANSEDTSIAFRVHQLLLQTALLEEFRAQCGTCYSPAVVALFDDSGFCRRLNEALDTERKKVYLQVYHAAGESF